LPDLIVCDGYNLYLILIFTILELRLTQLQTDYLQFFLYNIYCFVTLKSAPMNITISGHKEATNQ